jgi:predicted nuclease of restriction endonuclease-like (RecB) superfamily
LTHEHFPGRIEPTPCNPVDYIEILAAIRNRIQEERLRVVLSANAAMVLLYRDIGRMILERQEHAGWGSRVIDRLAADLRTAFPDLRGFSARNLKYMRAFADAWPERAIVQQAAAQIPWYHNCLILDRVKGGNARTWYIAATIREGWSRNIPALQIDGRAHERQGRAITNFREALTPADSDLAGQVFKDPYLFDFLGTADPCREREIEQALVDHIQRFLLELGTGFAFVGRQVPLAVGDQDFQIDLLFYHLKLRCYVVVELKAVPFDPAFIGQLNLYLSATGRRKSSTRCPANCGAGCQRSKRSKRNSSAAPRPREAESHEAHHPVADNPTSRPTEEKCRLGVATR